MLTFFFKGMSRKLCFICARSLFKLALPDYQIQMGTALASHPLAKKLQNCDLVKSVITVLEVLQDQA